MQQQRCALRITVGILVILAAACGKDKVAKASGPAGHVSSMQGDVSATRSGQSARSLKVDDVIFGDDTIRTGANASVEVLLDHNGARWQFGPNSERRVESSAAWRAQKQNVAVLDPYEQLKTGSAGRNTTREAAESSETLLRDQESPSPVLAPASTESAPAPSAAPPAQSPLARSKPARIHAASEKKQESPREEMAQGIEARGAGRRAEESAAAPPAPPPPSDKLAESSADDEGPGAGGASNESSRKRPTNSAPDALRSRVLAIATQCHAKHGGRGRLSITLRVKGDKILSLSTEGPDLLKAARTCTESSLRRASLPEAGPMTITISLP